MFDWLHNPHADYVLAAYTLAVVALGGLGFVSVLKARRVRRDWEKLQK